VDDASSFSSSSSRRHPGAACLSNVTSSEIHIYRIVDALLHEAIHSFLYALEREMPFYRTDHPVEPRVNSPWTGVNLALHAFVHACFVWFTLARFWSRALSAGGTEPAEAGNLLNRALRGFENGELDAALRFVEPHLTLESASALKTVRQLGSEFGAGVRHTAA
jgi:HEXXH motif-containing protein